MSAALACVTLGGCDRTAIPNVRTANGQTASKPQDLTDSQIAEYLQGVYATVVPSHVRSVTGDLRPHWIVAGRISNKYSHDLKKVKVRLTAFEKDENSSTVLDTAEFEVEDVPAMQARAFRRQVQLMVFPKEFRFTCTILSATVTTDN